MSLVLSYDLGTGGLKASLFDEKGVSRASSFRPYNTYFEKNFRDQDPDDWFNALIESTRELLSKDGVKANDIAAIAVSGHSLGIVPVGGGELLSHRVPIWNDSRATAEACEFFKTVDEKEWYTTTGNGFPAGLYSICKLMWLKKHQPQVYNRADKFIGTKDYINFKLTGQLATDCSYASGSGVWDLKNWCYREDYILASGIDSEKLVTPVESTAVVGYVTAEASALCGLPQGIPVVCGGVDNSCMALGAGCYGEGEAYTSLGTSSWIAVSSGSPITDTVYKPYVFAHCVPNKFVSATSIFSAGSSLAWVRDNLCKDLILQQQNGGMNAYDAMTALASTSQVGANGLLFNPSLAGGSSLEGSPDIRGAFLGLDLKHTTADVIRATLEGICLNLRIALDILEQYVPLSNDMLIVGGGGKSAMWRQLFASIYNKNITQISVGQDAGSLGAAALGAVGVGLWSDFDMLKEACKVRSRVSPIAEDNQKYEKLLPIFRQVAQSLCHIAELMKPIV